MKAGRLNHCYKRLRRCSGNFGPSGGNVGYYGRIQVQEVREEIIEVEGRKNVADTL